MKEDYTSEIMCVSILSPFLVWVLCALCIPNPNKSNESNSASIEINETIEDLNVDHDVDFKNIYKLTTSIGEEHYCTLMTINVNENVNLECYYDIYSDNILALKGQEEELGLMVEKINNDDYTNELENKLKVKSIN